MTLSAFANYVAAHNDLDLSRDAAIGGSYKGLNPMGLFESMEMTSEEKIVFKMVSGRVEHWPYRIRVFEGHTEHYNELKYQFIKKIKISNVNYFLKRAKTDCGPYNSSNVPFARCSKN